MDESHCCRMYQAVFLACLVTSLLPVSAPIPFELKCSKFLEVVNYCQRRSSSSSDSSQLPTYSDVPEDTTTTKDEPSYNAAMYIEAGDEAIDPALRQEIESQLSLQNPVNVPNSFPLSYGAVEPHSLKQEPKLKKHKIINVLYNYFQWDEYQKRRTSKVAKVAGRIAGDVASMMVAERFRNIGMAAGDIARILVSDLAIKSVDGFRAVLGLKI